MQIHSDKTEETLHNWIMEKNKKPDGRHKRREENRKKTLEMTLLIILETGTYPDIDTIAEKTGLSRRSIFHYFNNGNELLLAVSDLFTEQMIDRFNIPEADPVRSLEDTMLQYLEFRVRFNEVLTPLRQVIEERKRTHPELQDNIEIKRKRVLGRITELFSPFYPDEEEFENIKKMLFCNFSWNIWVLYRIEFRLSIEESRVLLEKQIRAILGFNR